MTISDHGRLVRARLGVRDWLAIATVLAGVGYSYIRMQLTTGRLEIEVASGNDRQERVMREMTDEMRAMRISFSAISDRVTRLEAAWENRR